MVDGHGGLCYTRSRIRLDIKDSIVVVAYGYVPGYAWGQRDVTLPRRLLHRRPACRFG